MTPTVVLVGLPGVGKSTSGRRLAKILAVPFADSDELIAELTGRTIPELFAESGEEAFRVIEADAIEMALHQFTGVLALGGGALTTRATRVALRASSAPVVQLKAKVDTLSTRVGDARTRPLLADDPFGILGQLEAERVPVYDRVANYSVDTDGRTPGQVAATLAARLHAAGLA